MALTHKEQGHLDVCLRDYTFSLEHTPEEPPEIIDIPKSIEGCLNCDSRLMKEMSVDV